jgi:hypothetical protein
MFVYTIDPIDHWYGWKPLTEVIKETAIVPEDIADRLWLKQHEILEFWNKAQKLAQAQGWEGDIRGAMGDSDGGPRFAPLPLNSPGDYAFVIAWKQDNNGDTFVASSIPLPWLINNCDAA